MKIFYIDYMRQRYTIIDMLLMPPCQHARSAAMPPCRHAAIRHNAAMQRACAAFRLFARMPLLPYNESFDAAAIDAFAVFAAAAAAA